MRKLLLVLALCLLPSLAFAQCNGVFPNNTACGNVTGTSAPPRAIPLTSIPTTLRISSTIVTGATSGFALTTTGTSPNTVLQNIPFPGASGITSNVQYNCGGQFCGDSEFNYNGSGQVVINTVPLSAINAPAINTTTAWGNVGVKFDAPWFMSVTTSAFAQASQFIDIQNGAGLTFWSVGDVFSSPTMWLGGPSANTGNNFTLLNNAGSALDINAPTNSAVIEFTAGNLNNLFVINPATNPVFSSGLSSNIGWASIASTAGTNDTGLSRDKAGQVDVGNGTFQDKSGTVDLTQLILQPLTIATLPTCVNGGGIGRLAYISNGVSPVTYTGIVSNTGTFPQLVACTGSTSNWTYH